MAKVTYEIVEHDGGWAYRVDGVYSETFPSHDLARRARGKRTDRPGGRDGHLLTKTSRAAGTTKCPQAMTGPKPRSRVVGPSRWRAGAPSIRAHDSRGDVEDWRRGVHAG